MYVVDPSGDDSGPGTVEQPFRTLDRAREAAAPGDVVALRGGLHRRTAPFRLTAADSGVTYRAFGHGTADREVPVVSGGRRITGWRAGPRGTRLADVPGPAVRQLYVHGRRADRASVEIGPGFTRTATGYAVDDPRPATWTGEVELVYPGAYPWSEPRCPVARICGDDRSSVLTMAQPAFGWAAELYRAEITWDGPGAGTHHGLDSPGRAENSPAFLTEGTFAHADGVLHHLPRPGETADDVVVPVLETLLHLRGAHDVAFRGIVFAETAWGRPGTERGFLHYHGNGFYDGGPLETVVFADGQGRVTVPGGEPATIPGGVLVEDCARVAFEGCRFTRAGGVAVEVRGGADTVLSRCTVDDAAGGGVVVDGGARHRVEDSHVHHVGRDHRGSPAVLVTGTEDAVVARNLVEDVPHAGIVLYPARGTRVLANLVQRTMQVLADGGGIYLSGAQGDSHASGALVRGNVVRDTTTPYNVGLYTDYGAAWVVVAGNVVLRADTPVVLHVSPPLAHVAFVGNVWDADPGEPPEGVALADNTTLPAGAADDDPAVADVLAGAGPGAQANSDCTTAIGSR